jgi:hypothetical protein
MKSTFKKPPAPPPMPRSWKRAIQRLDHVLEQNAPADYSERIDMLGRQLFGHLWKPRELDSKNSPNQPK